MIKIAYVEIFFFSVIRIFSAAVWRVIPSLPQRGKQDMGSVPVSPFFGVILTLSGFIAIEGMPER